MNSLTAMNKETLRTEKHKVKEVQIKRRKSAPLKRFDLVPPQLVRSNSLTSESSIDAAPPAYPSWDTSLSPVRAKSCYRKGLPRMGRRHRRAVRNKQMTRAALVIFAFMLGWYHQVEPNVSPEDVSQTAMGMLGLLRTVAVFWALITWQRHVKEGHRP